MKYKDWAPTQFDQRGLALPDRQEWLVCPTARNRDSGPLDESNFAAAIEIFEALPQVDDEPPYEVARFGHWGPGWFEIILVHPAYAAECEKLEGALEDYPVLDEMDFCKRESEAEQEAWTCWAWKDFVSVLVDEYGLSDTTRDRLGSIGPDRLWELYCSPIVSGEYSTPYDSGPSFSFGLSHWKQAGVTRDALAKWLWANRRERS